jgi:lipoprotein NlpI
MKARTLAALLLLAGSTMSVGAASYDDLNVGIQFHNMGQWKETIFYLDKAIAANDLVPSLRFVAHMDRGVSHHILQNYDLAIADYSAGLALQPRNPLALHRRALAYLTSEKFDLAVADLDTLLAAKPLLSEGYRLRAVANARRREFGKSTEDLKSLVSMRPTSGYGLDAGIIAWQTGEMTSAQKNFAWAIRDKQSIYAWLWSALAEARLRKDVPRRSLPTYDKAKWPALIVELFLGERTQESVLTAAAQSNADAVDGRLCEANFYVGVWLLQHQKLAEGAPLIRKAANDCPMDMMEWSPAQMELANLP